MPQTLSVEALREVFPEIEQIQNPVLKRGVEEIWLEIAAEMPWNDLNEMPKNTKGEKGRSLVEHIRGVTQMALALCEVAKTMQGKPYDRDLLLAACLLHDVSKPVEYEPDPSASTGENGVRPGRQSAMGRSIQHAAYATHKIFEKKLPLELAHLVLTHTHASGMRGKTWEAAALFYADFADTDAALHTVKDTLYIQRWQLGK
jgi:HD superfamily phosphohydrolase YqeK